MTPSSGRREVYERVAETRGQRADYEAVIESGGADLGAIFARAETDPVIGGMKLLPLLEALPDVGKVQSRRALAAAGIAESERAGAVDADRRVALELALFAPESSP